MLSDLLKEAIVYAAGKSAEGVVDLLHTEKHVNEFLIAKKLDLTINQTRNILYKVSDHSLVSSIRKKDKKKGWYTYFWKIEILKSLEFLKKVLLEQIGQIKEKLKIRELKQFYTCQRCNLELTEENALLQDFTCNECGDVFVIKDNSKILKEFRKNISKLEEKLSVVDKEIEKEQEKIGKKKIREVRKIAKEKAEQRAKARKERKKIKEKEKKKISAKKPARNKSPNKKSSRKKAVKKTAKKKAVKKKRK